MIRRILLYLMPIALGIAVLIAARQLDSKTVAVQAPQENPTTGNAAQVEVPAESREILAVETEPQVTAAGEETIPETTEMREEEPSSDRILLTFAGDCTFGGHTHYESVGYGFNKTVGDNYDYPFANVRMYFAEDDLTLLNLEGPLTNEGASKGGKFSFRGKPEYVSILSENSVEAVSLANNHSGDYGEEGYDSTKNVLKEEGIFWAERDAATVITLENGVTVGLYGATYHRLDSQTIVREIRNLREQADVVIFVVHWGTEGAYKPHNEQTELAHQAIDAGADIVYGTHPRVLQPIEVYGDGVIFYSLGNFSFGGNAYPEDLDTALVQQELIRDESGKLVLGERKVVPCSVSSVEGRNNYQPTPYAEGSSGYQRVMSKLDGSFTGRNLSID